MLRVVIALFLAFLYQQPTRPPLSVCDVLRNLHDRAGQTVTIRAVLNGGRRHGYYLGDNRDDTPCSGMSALAADWPSTMDYAWPGDLSVSRPRSPFEKDQSSEEKLREAIEQLQAGVGRETVEITITGQVRTKNGLKIFHDKSDGSYFGNGFGRVGMHAAQFVIKTIERVDLK